MSILLSGLLVIFIAIAKNSYESDLNEIESKLNQVNRFTLTAEQLEIFKRLEKELEKDPDKLREYLEKL